MDYDRSDMDRPAVDIDTTIMYAGIYHISLPGTGTVLLPVRQSFCWASCLVDLRGQNHQALLRQIKTDVEVPSVVK